MNEITVQEQLLSGVNLLVDTVKITLGTKGKTVMFNKFRDFDDTEGYPVLTKDGVTVAKQVKSTNPVEELAIQVVRESAQKTVEASGDGPQPLYSKVLTPQGFVDMGSLKMGQEICGTNGSTQIIEGIFPKGEKEIYEVHFKYGRIVECCEDHLWNITTIQGINKTLSLKDIIESNTVEKIDNRGYKRHNFFVPRTYVDFSVKVLPVDPYLLGTLSSTKFIPKEYLYSSLEQRKQLLQGLIDTDGHINNRNLFEYCTESIELRDGFLELCRGLGIATRNKLHHIIDKDSHSNTSIYRITQLKGCKYGDSIEKILPKGEKTEMQCIKVSNPDQLYITDNYIVTHNTTSTCILAQSIIQQGFELLNKGMSSWEFNRYADEAMIDVVQQIRNHSFPVEGSLEVIEKLAGISSNEPYIGKLIRDIIEEVGVYADIEPKRTQNYVTDVELVKGMKLHKGYFAPFMCTDMDKLEFHADTGCYVLIFDGIIRDYNDIAEYVRLATTDTGDPIPILIFADDIATTALNRLQGLMKYSPRPMMIVEHDGFGDRKIELMNDISIVTGGFIVDVDTKSKSPKDMMGWCEEVLVNQKYSCLFRGTVDEEALEQEVKNIQRKIEVGNLEKSDAKFYNKRLANLIGGIAVINVGGKTRVEMEETYTRIEDAVLAVRSALRDGVTIGGGYTWIKIMNKLYDDNNHPAYNAIVSSLAAIPYQLLLNAGESTVSDELFEMCIEKDRAYDLSDSKFYDIKDYQVFDASSVLVDSVINAVAVSKSILSIGRVISNGTVYI